MSRVSSLIGCTIAVQTWEPPFEEVEDRVNLLNRFYSLSQR
jgi:hypothetical protein